MELSILPSQFLSVVLEENDKHNGSSVCTTNRLSQSLSSSVTISPVVSKTSTPKKRVNGISSSLMKNGISKLANGALRGSHFSDLKRLLPRTVWEECIVEYASSPSKRPTAPESSNNAVIIKPMYKKRVAPPQVCEQPGDCKKETVDIHDLFAGVEAVYSDDDEQATPSIVAAKLNDNFTTQHTDLNSLDVIAAPLAYACDHCPNKYLNKGALWQHNVATHSVEKSCECQLCGRRFYRNCSLALHMKCHSDEQNCSCKVCGKEFNRLSALERHVKSHNAEAAAGGSGTTAITGANMAATSNATSVVNTSAPTTVVIANSATTSAVGVASTAVTSAAMAAPSSFACKICGKYFADEVTLRAHVYVHNEKFTCEHCHVTFNNKQLLDLHFHITHKRSETPFACKLCKMRFANLRELNEHAATHANEKVSLPCHHCGEVFTQQRSLKKHLQLHQGERLSCTFCGIDFTQRSSLLRHNKRLHQTHEISNRGPILLREPPPLTIITK